MIEKQIFFNLLAAGITRAMFTGLLHPDTYNEMKLLLVDCESRKEADL